MDHSPLRVLVVDDDADTANSSAALLRHCGYETAVALDGEDALGRAAQLAPDVVLLDLGMPLMDGFEVARRLRRPGGALPPFIIAVTGHDWPEDRLKCSLAGIDAHLVKPVSETLLSSLITAL